MMSRARIREIVYVMANLRQSMIPKETCPDVSPGEFDIWYGIVMHDPQLLVHKPGLKYSPEVMEWLKRMKSYIPEHFSHCDICQRRYEAKKHISAAFRSILGIENKPEYVM